MINRPSIEELEKIIGMRYIVVLAAARRARDITAGSTPYIKTTDKNPLTIATRELYDGYIQVVKNLSKE